MSTLSVLMESLGWVLAVRLKQEGLENWAKPGRSQGLWYLCRDRERECVCVWGGGGGLPTEGPLPASLLGDSLRDLVHQILTCRAGESCQHCCGPHCGPFWHKPGSRSQGRQETGELSSVLLTVTYPVLPPSLALLPPELRAGSSGTGTTREVL